MAASGSVGFARSVSLGFKGMCGNVLIGRLVTHSVWCPMLIINNLSALQDNDDFEVLLTMSCSVGLFKINVWVSDCSNRHMQVNNCLKGGGALFSLDNTSLL